MIIFSRHTIISKFLYKTRPRHKLVYFLFLYLYSPMRRTLYTAEERLDSSSTYINVLSYIESCALLNIYVLVSQNTVLQEYMYIPAEIYITFHLAMPLNG